MSFFKKFAFLGGKKRGRWWERPFRSRTNRNPYTGKIILPSRIKRNHRRQFQTKLTMQNMDDEWFGESVDRKPEKSVTRFMLMNCRGLPYTDMNFFRSFLTSIMEKNVHYFSLPEININTYNEDLKVAISSATETVIPGGFFHMINSKVLHPMVAKQPGGVAAGFHGRLRRKYHSTKYDDYGRWLVHQFNGSKRSLKIYNLYRVNPKPYKSSNTTAWDQQFLLLRNANINIDPRKQVINDLLRALQEDTESGYSILLFADLNEPVDGLEQTNLKIENLGLNNVFQSRFGTLPKTHIAGRKAIDHIWATKDVEDQIVRAGFAPFRYVPNSDHRPIFVDIDFHTFLEEKEIDIKPQSARKLKSSTPKRVSKYNEIVQKSWKFHKMQEKWKSAKTTILEEGVNEHNENWVNRIDAQITAIMREGEGNSTSIKRPITLPWSRTLHTAIRGIYESAHKKRVALRTTEDGIFDEELLKQRLDECDEARHALRTVTAEADQYRDKMVNEQATAAKNREGNAHVGDKTYIKIIRQREKQRIDALRMNRVLGKQYGGSVTKILIPAAEEYEGPVDIYNVKNIWKRVQKSDGKDIKIWVSVTDRAQVERLLLQWQRAHFEQAQETPFSSKQWRHHLEDDITQAHILDGQYTKIYDIPDESMCLLQCMKRRTDQQIDSEMHFHEFLDYYRKVKESTSSSPSGRHYGHYKALLEGDISILEVIFDIMSFCLSQGLILDRWKNSVTSLIEKIEGKPYIHKFRTIHVVESELQYFSKIIYAKRMMKLAERENIITDDQYGGRAQRQATSAVLNKVLYYAICRQIHMPCAFMDDDAKACYDRIIPNLAEIESRKWGVPYKTTKITTGILKKQRFFVKTGFGISDAHYSFQDDDPIFGVGQGLGWSGPIWLNTADTISRLMKMKCAGMRFISSEGHIIVEKNGDFFVDDTSTGVTANCVKGSATVLEQLMEDEQWHAYALFSAGHRLALHKCSFYIVEFQRKGLKYVCKTIDELPGEMKLREGFNLAEKTVPRLEPSTPHKTLGHYISITENYERQYEVLRQNIEKWGKKIRTSSLKGQDRILAYNSYLLPSIRYKIMSTNLTYEECEEMGKIIAPIILNAYGLHRNCSRNMIYQPYRNFGLQIQHLYHVKGFEKLRMTMMHLRRDDTTAKLLRIAISYMNLECGSRKQCLELSYKKWSKFTTSTWLTDLWKYMDECSCRLIVNSETYSLPRKNDFWIMDVVESSPIEENNKVIFNQIRLWMQIATASDIVTLDKGSSIMPGIWTYNIHRKSTWNWPAMEPPHPSWKEIWTSVLRSIILPEIRKRPLGEWIHPTHQQWTTMADHDLSHVQTKGNIYQYSQRKGQRVYTPTLCLCPVDMWRDKVIGFQLQLPTKSNPMPQENVQKTLEQEISRLSGWRLDNLGYLPHMQQLLAIKSSIMKGECISAGDGSLRHAYPGHAWCFASTNTYKILCQGAASVRGPVHEITSLRAEGCAILAQLTIIELLDKVYDFHGKQIVILSDCDSLIRKISRGVEYSTKYALQDDIDIVLQIRKMLRSIQCKISIRYVRSHRDRVMRFEDASFHSQLNILMDEAVRKYIDANVENTPRRLDYSSFDFACVSIKMGNSAVVHDIENKMITNFHHPKWKTAASKQLDFNPTVEAETRSDIFAKLMKRERFHCGQIVKLMHNQHHTMSKSKQWRLSRTDRCPLCMLAVDEAGHFWTCPNAILAQSRSTQKLEFVQCLEKLHTDPALQSILMIIIDNWMNTAELRRRFQKLDLKGNIWQRLWYSQEVIGWDNANRGILSSIFLQIQNDFYRDNGHGPSRTGETWYAKVVSQLWKRMSEIWKARCDILHKSQESSAEMNFRDEAFNFFTNIKSKAWCFTADDQHLLQKNQVFFQQASYDSIDMWRRQVEAATQTARFQSYQHTKDIRTYFPVQQLQAAAPRKKMSRTGKQKSLIPTQVIYRQMTLNVMSAKRPRNDRRQCQNDPHKIRDKKMMHLNKPGEKERAWLAKVKHRRRERKSNMCALNVYFNSRHEDESCHPAVPPVEGTRKIKN